MSKGSGGSHGGGGSKGGGKGGGPKHYRQSFRWK